MLFSDSPLLEAVFSCFLLTRRLIRVRLPAIGAPGVFQETCRGAVYPRPENAAQRMIRAGVNPAPTLADKDRRHQIPTTLRVQFLEEPGHVLAEDLHGLQAFRILIDRALIQADSHVPVA